MAEEREGGLVLAAGAVVWAPGPSGVRVALVHRMRYDDWSLPKGKCQPGEHLLETAVREVAEETGQVVTLGRPLSSARYQVDGQPKRVDYWSASRPAEPSTFAPNDEADRLDWLAVPDARTRLSYGHDREVLDEFAAGPAVTVPCILVRHASAGRGADWPGDDLDRPLDGRGTEEAAELARMLACYGSARVISSAARRCTATVAPYAALTGAAIEIEPLFTAGQAESPQAAARAAAIAGQGQHVVICVHRENLPLLLGAICQRLGAAPPQDPRLPKGGFWALHAAAGRLAGIERHHPADKR